MLYAELFYRQFELARASVDAEKRTAELSFSSDTPVERWFGSEILLHGADNVDLSRLEKMGALLLNHNPGVIVGPIDKAWLDGNKGRALVRFDEDEDGERALKKVVSGSLRGVSVGYRILKFREIQEKEEWEGIKGPAMVATRWMPYEISLTPIPADATVGIGREATRSLDGIDIERTSHGAGRTAEAKPETINQEEKEMTPEEIKRFIEECLGGLRDSIVSDVRQAMTEAGKPRFRVTAEEALALTGQAAAVSPETKTRICDMIIEGRSREEISAEIVRIAVQRPDAKDSGSYDPSDAQGKRGAPVYRSVDEMPDDLFIRMITDPEIMPIH